MVASELTGQALARGGGAELLVRMRLGVLHVGLRANGPVTSTPAGPADAEGLCLVNATAAYWGFLRAGGDTVWCAGLVA